MIEELRNSSKRYSDERGYLEVVYENNGLVLKRSFSKKNVLRGLHHQKKPYQQTKIIRVIEGAIIDFVVDMDARVKKIVAKKIDKDSGWVKINENCAHGFFALSDVTFEYICIGEYNEKYESAYSISDYVEKKYKTVPIVSLKDGMGEKIEIDEELYDF